MREVKTRKRRSKLLIIPLSILLVFVFIAGFVFIWDAPARAELQNMVIADLDFSNLNDGTYTGEYRGTKNSVRDVAVEITVKSGNLTKIKVTEGAFAGGKENDEIKKGVTIADLFGKVIESQSLQVDAVSGATVTTNAHLKAIENALLKAQAKKQLTPAR